MTTRKGKNLQFELAKCTAKRDMYYGEIQELYNLSLRIEESDFAQKFSARYVCFQDIWEKLHKMVEVVNDLSFELSPEYKPNYELLRNAETLRYSIMEAAKIFKRDNEPTERNMTFKLPKITLPEFNGEITQWPIFIEKFNAIIHNNPNLDELSKMHYLLGALKGSTLELCAGLTPSASNYSVLLNALKARYGNKRIIANHYFDQMAALKPLAQENPSLFSQTVVRFDTAYKSLKKMQLPDLLDYWAASWLLSKFDPNSRREFETSQHEQIPTYEEVLRFAFRHIEALSQIPKKSLTMPRLNLPHSGQHPVPLKTFVNQVRPNQSAYKRNTSQQSFKCPVCGQPHQTFRCQSFSKLSPIDRLKLVQKQNLCFNCLSNTHTIKSCNSASACRICQQSHHTLLHLENSSDHAESSNLETQSDSKPVCNFFTNSHANFDSKNHSDKNVVLLPTAVVLIVTPFGEKKARFLIDSGSQRHFISYDCCKNFHLSFRKKLIPLEGMGNVSLQAMGETQIVIKSLFGNNRTFKISALVTEKITHRLPTETINCEQLKYLQDLPLADEKFFRPGPIHGILGAQLFGKILEGTTVFGPDQSSQAIKTSLGYVVLGDVKKNNSNINSNSSSFSTFCIFDNNDLCKSIQRFWELEEVPKIPKLTDEEKECEELYKRSTTRLDGRNYCVQLPFKEFPPALGDSFQTAKRRFLLLERKLSKNSEFRSQYVAAIQDYLDQGHMSFVAQNQKVPETAFFIPHFAVVKESSSTPLRVVFDASAKTSNARSLNDVLFTGPKLQKNISKILISFRVFAIALIADIKQMYRNIVVDKPHRCFQRILWRKSQNEDLKVYELNCVVFGVSSAPYLALRTVQQLAMDESINFPLASELAKEHMYVDDLVLSLESVPQALEAYQQLVGLFKAGGFRLTKWASNSLEVLEKIPPEDRLSRIIDFAEPSKINDSVKVLGLKWDSASDFFGFAISSFRPIFSKRGVLSVIARIWDPLGFLAPVTLHAKLLMKDLWTDGLGWDDDLPLKFKLRWQQFMLELPCLREVKIPRCFGISRNTSVALVGFADSSEKAYGAVVYLRQMGPNYPINLIYAKSRVAPQKVVSLPRLELCAAVLLSELIKICVEILAPDFPKIQKFAFTDSTVTLYWLKNASCKRDTFVAHRISAIELVLKPNEWYHVSSHDNAADCISRGLPPAQLLHRDTWFHGPAWLNQSIEDWPMKSELPHLPPNNFQLDTYHSDVVQILLNTEVNDWFFEFLKRFSSLKRLLHVTVHLLRFCKRLPLKPKIDASDLEFAERIIVREVQQRHFSAEISCLKNNKITSSKIRFLSPFLDKNILRVGGRLSNADVPYEVQHPILLPKNSHLSSLIIDDCHRSNFHTGPDLVLSLIRQRFWILSARNLVRKCIKACNWCFKRKPRPTYPSMADLPASRVQEAKPFLHTGVDYAGPFRISISRHRGVKSQKAYLCLFVCLVTKAIHLELASSLSTDTFLDCFKRFISRRGAVSTLYSDQGTNFIGAKARLDEIYEFVQSDNFLTPIQEYLENRRIAWKFNPPHAPHFGGLWEGNIRSVKTHLSKVIGSQILTYEEFNTVLVQIEALLNSRPLVNFHSDPSEPQALTPAHFLTLTPLRSLPSTPISNKALRDRKELLDIIVQSFWKRWHLEYLTSLQSRSKWNTPSNPITLGKIVIIKSDNVPPLQWPLGIVEEIHPAADGIVRAATVRVGKALYKRPVIKLCPLPTQ